MKSFEGFFTVVGEEVASKIVFCSAMWEPYLNVICEKSSEVLDRQGRATFQSDSAFRARSARAKNSAMSLS